MQLEVLEQLKRIFEGSKEVLIVTGKDPDVDMLSAARALYFLLEKKGINSSIAFSDEANTEERINFLPRPERVSDSISGTCDFVLSFKTKFNKIIDVKSEYLEDEVRVYVTPERGSLDPRDFSFIPARYKFDLIIFLGARDKESIGKVFDENPDIFYEIPIVNIDYHPENENFGHINAVSLTASSVSEIVFEIFESIDKALIDETVANLLLAGIIGATDSFQKKNTTPKSMQAAAHLMDIGADQQQIVRFLYKTQPLHILKLWGRVMARLNWNEEIKLAWSLVSIEDFVQSRSSQHDVPFILDKIKENYSAGKIFVILYNEKAEDVVVMIKCAQVELAQKIAQEFQGELRQEMVIIRMEGRNILDVEKEIIEKIKTLV